MEEWVQIAQIMRRYSSIEVILRYELRYELWAVQVLSIDYSKSDLTTASVIYQ